MGRWRLIVAVTVSSAVVAAGTSATMLMGYGPSWLFGISLAASAIWLVSIVFAFRVYASGAFVLLISGLLALPYPCLFALMLAVGCVPIPGTMC